MTTLVLGFHSALQSWGTRSKLSRRDTFSEPTRSALVGMIRAALGDPRDSDGAVTDQLSALEVTVRTDRPGRLLRDMHNTTASPRPVAQTASGSPVTTTIMSNRWYLSDAAFLVALRGDRALVDRVAAALLAPRWHLSLGRRACPPAAPLVMGVLDADPLDVVASAPAIGGDGRGLVVSVPAQLAEVCEGRGWSEASSSAELTTPVPGARAFTPEARVRFKLPGPVPVGTAFDLRRWCSELGVGLDG